MALSWTVVPKPRQRSVLRLAFGKLYFTLKRYCYWYFSGTEFAQSKGFHGDFPFVVFSHQTPLLRKLRKVEMWLQYNKVANLRIAVKKIDGVVLHPGETFSYWRLIGKPTARKGYKAGMVLFNGTFTPGIGGGLCQLSNLIYWMTLHTPLTVVERWRHSYDVFPDVNRTQPFGSGATCSYNYIDLQIRNNTRHSFYLRVFLTEEFLAGEWRSDQPVQQKYEVYEKDHLITHEPWGGYVRHNRIYRRVVDDGEVVRDELVAENHAIMMCQPLLAGSAETC
ncbi:vancomycin resistance protein [Clostridiales bacterium PH28_bin88]|nr:vancomycin resistance protein [Clostridiales bacterium PH28_bin88]